MIVYLPILSLEGVEGRMFRPMAMTVIFVLVGSLICSLSLTPVLASLVLTARSPRDVLLVRVARHIYTTALERLLPWRKTLVAVSLGLLGWCGWLAAGLGTEFVPRLDEGTIVIGISRPPGTSLDENLRINQRMEQQLVTAFPDEVDYLWSRAGAPEVPTDASTVEMTDMFVALRPRDGWTKAHSQADLVRLFEEQLRDCPGQVVWYTQPIEQRTNELISGARGDVAIKLFGEDFEQLRYWAEKIAKVLRSVPGCRDITTEQTLGQPILRIDVRQDELARYGVPVQSVMDIIESVGGKSVGEVLDGAWRFPLVVRLPESIRGTPESIADIQVESPSGELIPLSTLADVRIERGPRLISREWSKRRVMIQFNVRDRDVGSAVYDAQQKIDEAVHLPHGYRIEWGGQFENMRRAQRRLAIVGPISLSLILVLLYAAFRNRWDTAVIFGSIPFAMAGGIIALWLRSMPLSISAAIGFITLSGVAVLNSMVIVSAMRREYERVQPSVEAILRASSESVRTVLITMMVASIGFLPMAVSDGAGAEVQRPLASVVIGGMLVGTIATLILLPAFYAWRASRFRVF
jgi:cobalt-zinc-cadmium resistance protein CzcA